VKFRARKENNRLDLLYGFYLVSKYQYPDLDYENLKEELGDLLYDLMHLVEIGVEEGLFTTKEVIEQVNAKLVRRKPWVFGDEKIETAEAAEKRWNEIKAEEKKAKKEF